MCLAGMTILWPASAGATPPHLAWPVKTVVIQRAFVAPSGPYSAGHRGIDLDASAGDQIFSPVDGIVLFAGRVVDRKVLTLSDGGDWSLSFEAVDTSLSPGQRVTPGEQIGTVASGPHCACLHVGVRWRGAYVNPLLLFGRLPRAILLPW